MEKGVHPRSISPSSSSSGGRGGWAMHAPVVAHMYVLGATKRRTTTTTTMTSSTRFDSAGARVSPQSSSSPRNSRPSGRPQEPGGDGCGAACNASLQGVPSISISSDCETIRFLLYDKQIILKESQDCNNICITVACTIFFAFKQRRK